VGGRLPALLVLLRSLVLVCVPPERPLYEGETEWRTCPPPLLVRPRVTGGVDERGGRFGMPERLVAALLLPVPDALVARRSAVLGDADEGARLVPVPLGVLALPADPARPNPPVAVEVARDKSRSKAAMRRRRAISRSLAVVVVPPEAVPIGPRDASRRANDEEGAVALAVAVAVAVPLDMYSSRLC
jgi:hypothetical protein